MRTIFEFADFEAKFWVSFGQVLVSLGSKRVSFGREMADPASASCARLRVCAHEGGANAAEVCAAEFMFL